MKSKGAGNKTPSPTTSKIYLDGKDVQFTAYNIEGNNYFKLRDIGEAFDFGVTWDGARNTIVIDTSICYIPEGSAASETPSETTSPETGDDAVSKNALVGVWVTTGWADVYWWEFGANGSFAYYRGTISGSVSYWDEYFLKGKYRVNGNTIEYYDCQFDSYEEHALSGNPARNHEYFDNSKRLDMPNNLLLDTPLQNPKNSNDLSVKFEFIGTMTLRIVKNSGTLNMEYDDCDFDYHANSHDVTILAHSLPGVAWPKDKIPSMVPAYTDGRVRSVDDTTHAGEVAIIIDRTTRDCFANYINNLISLGWKASFDDVWTSDAMEGGSSFLQNGNAKILIGLRGDSTLILSFFGSW